MPKYILGNHLKGQGDRLELMSELLDQMHRRYIDALDVVKPGARTLEVGCGNGSISAWLAERVSSCGTAVAVDLDLSLIHARMPDLELRKADIVAGPVERGTFDFVRACPVLHHVTDAQAAIANMLASLKAGGALLLIEPDFLPISVAEPPEVRAFWDGSLVWSRERGIDYHIVRSLAPRLGSLCLTNISGTAETAVYNGGSLWADYWIDTITELRSDLIRSSKIDEALIDKFLAYCADSNWWTQTIGFTAVHARASAG
jgi:SAM-dependent methyltransferase